MHHRCTRCQRVRLWWRRFSVHSYRYLEPERNTATLNFSPLSSFILHSTKFITLSFCCSALLSQIWAMPDFSFFIICKSNTPYYDFCLFCIVLISLHILLYRLVSIWFYCPCFKLTALWLLLQSSYSRHLSAISVTCDP